MVITNNQQKSCCPDILAAADVSEQKSFLKYTAHTFKKYFRLCKPDLLKLYDVDAANNEREFRQRDSLAFELLKKQTIKQKLGYIHYNPVMAKWTLCKESSDYYYSSANFYERGIDNFKFTKHIVEVL